MLSDLENLDIMLGGNHSEREGSEFSDSSRKPSSPRYNAPGNNEENCYPNPSGNRSSNSLATIQLAQTLVLSLKKYQVSSIPGS